MDDREQKVYGAKLSEQADRYDDMTRLMTEVAELGCELSQEERNLLSVAFKNAVGARRASWRILTSLEQREEADSKRLQLIKEYREKIEGEMHERCSQLLQLLEKHILPASSDDEARVFFHKMAGDYHRYVAEFADGGARKQAAEESLLAYKAATEIAVAKLAPTHPVRLGLALNFSVFYYEILNSPDRACRLAKAAFDDAICELDLLSEDDYRDSTLIMQLLRDNLTLWTSDMQAADSSDAAAADNCDAAAADSDTAKVEAPQGEVAQPA